MRIIGLLILCGGLLLSSPATRADDVTALHAIQAHSAISHQYERLLMSTLGQIQSTRFEAAFDNISELVTQNPKFRLAQLIYADLLAARARGLTQFGDYADAPIEQWTNLSDEALVRWQHYVTPPTNEQILAHVVEMGLTQPHVVIVDLARFRLYVLENVGGEPRIASDYYISMGKQGADKVRAGDNRTPVGVYRITQHLTANRLPDLYGAGAFPVSYPNEWDRRLGRTGSGIWLHGTPSNTYARPPRASEGCVVLSNDDFNTLVDVLESNGTPVIFADRLDTLDVDRWNRIKPEFRDALANWRTDWESLDADRYLAHYSRDFRSPDKDYRAWRAYKQRVNSAKTYIKVEISALDAFVYPGERQMIVATFKQNYESNNVNSQVTKRQYWRLEADGIWRIVYEGTVS